MTISGSVGRGGLNRQADVEKIQHLLNVNQYRMLSAPCLVVNGNPNPETILAIEVFQREVLKFRTPDGLVEPGKRTIQALLESPPIPASIEPPSEEIAVIETGVLAQNHTIKFGEVLKSQYPAFPAVILDSVTLTKLLKDFGFTGQFTTVTSNGRQYIVLKGYPGLRTIFQGPRYVASNPKVVGMAIGKLGLAASVKASGFLTILTYAFIEAPQVVFQYKDETIGKLGVRFASDLTKVGLSTLASLLAGKAALATTGVVCAPLAAALVVGFTIGIGLEYADKRFKITQRLEEYVAKQQREFERAAVRHYSNFERGFLDWICSTGGVCLPSL